MFVQDFIHVGRPLGATVTAFELHVLPALGQLVHRTWMAGTVDGHLPVATNEVSPVVSGRRERDDSVVYSIRWGGNDATGLPAFDGDIEFAPLTQLTSHVQLSAQITAPSVPRWSVEGLQANRRNMASVGLLLTAIGATIDAGAAIVS